MSNSRTISWQAIVMEADPDFHKRSWVYEFSNDRRFLEPGIYPFLPFIRTEDFRYTIVTEEDEYIVQESSNG